jgi:hypothetical protein
MSIDKFTSVFLTVCVALAGVFGAVPGKGAPPEEGRVFNRIATYPVVLNLCQPFAGNEEDFNDCLDQETVSEIVAASEDGNILIYTDSQQEQVGFIDITGTLRFNPQPLGTLDVGGSPTSVAVVGPFALVAINTSPAFVTPDGELRIIRISDQTLVRTIDLGGQPDSIAVSPDRRYAAIVIENERDEDLGDGAPPQLPSGGLIILDLDDPDPTNWDVRPFIDLAGLSPKFPTDAEPEFVDINANNIAVITLQENNYIVLVDLRDGRIVKHFSAGTANLNQIDTLDERPNLILLSDSLQNVLREPDGVAWISNSHFATADEGDLEGGSRGWTIYDVNGNIEFTSGNALEHLAVQVGHYPDRRSDANGTEPEAIEFGKYGADSYVFVGSERGSFVAVYRLKENQKPEFIQVLPSTAIPEGLLAIPQRNLFVTSSEEDARNDGVRAGLTIYELQPGSVPNYPTVVSHTSGGTPIPWGALSGLAGDPQNKNRAYSIYDSFYDASRIFVMDVHMHPAVILREIVLHDATHPTFHFDPEGIAKRPSDYGYWIASEGAGDAPDAASLNLLLEVSEAGEVLRQIELPPEVNALQRSNGFEGVASVGTPGVDGGTELVFVAFQREWSGDPAGKVRIGRYEVSTGEWTFAYYPLDEVESPNGGWVGLSEITTIDDTTFAVIERDNQGNIDARIKRIYKFSIAGVAFKPQGEAFDTVSKILVRDVLPDLKAPGGLVIEKLEGLTKLADGDWLMVTDNDGVDGSSGETQLQHLGDILLP